jgi:hypothetical protein
MIRSSACVSITLLSLLCLMLFATPASPAQEDVQTGPEVIQEDYHDTSIPVREMAPEAPLGTSQRVVIPLRRRPWPPMVSSEPDAVSQNLQESPLVGTTNKLNFDGVADRDGVAPPDTNASVGSTQVVETVNTSYKVFNKSTGGSVFGPAEISRIWSGFGGVCGSGPDYSDPVVLYDKAAGRWLVTILASPDGFNTGVECIAVSTTSDATGSYHRYVFSFGTNNLNDYPKFGVWPDAYYASYNMFSPTSFLGAKVCAYPRAAMLAGTTAKSICFAPRTGDFSFLPSDRDGSTAPPTGEPNFYLELFTSTTLHLFKFHVDFTTPSKSKFTGPTTLTVPSFTEACPPTGTCIPQSGTGQKLDSLGDRLMFRLAYRNFGGHEALVATHSVKTSVAASGVRWYEIRSPNATPTVFQRGTLTSGSTSLWMGSIGMDKVGDTAVGFSESSSSIHPAIAYTGRVPTDALGTMESIDVVFRGNGSQTGRLSRWGDYTSISIDPSDDCTFWYANEYIPSNGSFNWHTRLNSFKFTGCM